MRSFIPHLLAAAIGMVAASSLPATGQELSPGILARIKAATALVQTRSGSGSAFLAQGPGAVRVLVTCEHVVQGSSSVDVIFGSGTANEVTASARVLGTDPDLDLACLAVAGAQVPSSHLEIAERTEVRETEDVFVAGFPFGERLSASSRHPEISLTKVVVSSVRRDEAKGVSAIQLSGDVNPGNSGGPVADGKGRVIGVAQSKMRGSQTAFAVPVEAIREFLQGRVSGVAFGGLSAGQTTVRVEATALLADPFNRLRSVWVYWLPAGEFSGQPKPDSDGHWGQVSPAMRNVILAIQRASGKALAAFDVPRPANDAREVVIVYQVSYTPEGGTACWGPPGTARIPAAAGIGYGAVPLPGKVEPQTIPPAAGKTDTLQPSVILPLHAAISDLILSKDGAHLYALDLSEGKIHKIGTADLRIAQQVSVADDAVAMDMSANGATLAVAARKAGAPPRNAQGPPDPPGGIVQVISTSSMRISASVPIEIDPLDVAVRNEGTVVVSNRWSDMPGLVYVDPGRKKTTAGQSGQGERANIQWHPDQTRLYLANENKPLCMMYRSDRPAAIACYGPPPLWQGSSGGPFEIVADGKLLLSASGTVLHLRKVEAPLKIGWMGAQETDLLAAGRVEPFLDAASSRGSVFVAVPAGAIKEYGAEDLSPKRTYLLDRVCTQLAADPKRRVLYGVACRAVSPDAYQKVGNRPGMSAGDIVVYVLPEDAAPAEAGQR